MEKFNLSRSFCIALFLVQLFFGIVQAQEKVWFEENFDNNDKNWFTVNKKGYFSLKVNDGFYRINLLSGIDVNYAFLSPYPIFIDPNKDFTLETTMSQTDGSEASGYGLIWGAAYYTDYYSFTISSKGKYRIVSYQNNLMKNIVKWTKTDFIKPKGKANKLSIVNKSGVINFKINGKVVHTEKSIDFIGNYIGFELNRNVKVKVDNIAIKQDNTINVVPELTEGIKKTNLGADINSVHREKAPIISTDGKILYLAVTGDTANVGIEKTDDIWFSKKNKWDIWSKRQNIGAPLNNSYANYVLSTSVDNNSIYLFGLYDPEEGEFAGEGISVSNKTKYGWSMPTEVKIDNYYNNASSQSFCFSSDGKILISSIEQDDSHGKLDLYISKLKKDGSWSQPKNMGATVNSFNNEITPFLAADGVTLFFSTDGRPGYGDADIFQSKRIGNSWTKWSEPENLGPEINTTDWDAYYTLPASGEYAYLVSSENSLGEEDIFQIKLPESAKPDPVVLVYGTVLNSKTNKPVEASIAYNDLITNEEVGIAKSDPTTGEYRIVLPSGRSYSFMASKQKFISISENISLPVIEEYEEIKKDLILTPIEVGVTVRLNNIFFDFGKSTLRKESFPELERVINLMTENENMRIEIGGHTDNKGSDKINLQISQERANAVMHYITSNGISADRVTSKGYGETRPTASNETEEGQQQNRRVEFTIVKN